VTPGKVSIPLEQGKVFRHLTIDNTKAAAKFQSLWSRARSFDQKKKWYYRPAEQFQSLWSRARSFDTTTVSQAESGIVSIPLEQGGVF
jgi:hypothetical protein